METRGRKPSYGDPAALRAAIDQYFTDCDAKKVFPDYAGMKLALKLSESDVKALQADSNENAPKYRALFEYARDRRESWLSRRMATDNKAAQGCMNNLKQPVNGGYIDKPMDSGEKTLNLNLVGVGGWDAFK